MKRCASLLAVLALVGCASTQPVGLPPAALLEDCPEPVAEVRTNGDLARLALDLKLALALCNNDKAALRAWAETK